MSITKQMMEKDDTYSEDCISIVVELMMLNEGKEGRK
jgi:hypothetical protein